MLESHSGGEIKLTPEVDGKRKLGGRGDAESSRGEDKGKEEWGGGEGSLGEKMEIGDGGRNTLR